ncbi:MAG: rod shape-determining protein RodA [Candidatus Moranbacteria bacterium]|nr:rod shape-determining protein RodA [Candidatus Moranbacteria bacterium]
MNKILQFDWILLAAIVFLGGIGILALYSISPDAASGGYAFRQLIFFGCGMLGLVVFASFDYSHVQKYSTPLYFWMVAVLIGVLLWGKTVNGTEGWINLGIARFQPVEAAKPILILFLASFISKKKTELGELVRLVVSLVLASLLIMLVLKQPDLGSALVLTGIWAGMIFISGMRFKHFAVMLMIGVCAIGIGWSFLAPYQKDRIMTVIEPQIDPKGSGYNVIQATVAVGSGGIIGKGIGHGSQSQLNFLPEKHTDFIFSVISEELGLIGSFLVIFLYGVILYRLSRIASLARDNFGFLVTTGVMLMIFIQVVVNIGMNIGLLPVTGIPLPFLSYGGSSLLSMLLSFGLIMSIFLKKKSNAGLQVSLDRSLL